MKRTTALRRAKESDRVVARPRSWSGSARGLRWNPTELGWVELDFSPSDGCMAYSGRSVPTPIEPGPWKVVPRRLLAGEADELHEDLDRQRREKLQSRRQELAEQVAGT